MSFPAELGTAEWTMIWGAGIALVSILVLWRLSRYDLVGAAWDSAWHVEIGRASCRE